MNKAGDRFVASAPYGDTNFSNGGEIAVDNVYQYDGSNWSKVGSTMGQRYSSSLYYGVVAINGAGDRIAFGEGYNGRDRVYIYGESGGVWSQLQDNQANNSSIYNSNGTFGASLDFNEEGNILGVGSRDQVRLYEYSSGTWTQKGDTRDYNDQFGASLALSASMGISTPPLNRILIPLDLMMPVEFLSLESRSLYRPRVPWSLILMEILLPQVAMPTSPQPTQPQYQILMPIQSKTF